MIDITIAEDFAAAGVTVALGCIQCGVSVARTNADLEAALAAEQSRRVAGLAATPIPEIPAIAAARRAYRALGKDPTRYRVSSEALMRRIKQGKGLYRVNTVVDTGNLISVRTGHSVGAFRAEAIAPPAVFRKARPGETYAAIGRYQMNLENLPVFADAEGPFGSPTSDSERTMITDETATLLFVIIALGGDPTLAGSVADAAGCLERFAAASDIETAVIAGGAGAPGR